MTTHKALTPALTATIKRKKRATVTLHDRTTGRRVRPGPTAEHVKAVVLTEDAELRLLQEVKRGVHSAHTSGQETHVVIRLAPRGLRRDVDLVKVQAVGALKRERVLFETVTAVTDARIRETPRVMEIGLAPRGKHSDVELVKPQAVAVKQARALHAAMADARARGTQRVAQILADPAMLSADAFGRYIGVSREAVRLKHLRHEILGLSGAKRGIRYPKWQLTDADQPLPGLPELFRILGGNPWTVYRFLLQHHPELEGETALAVLKTGAWQRVLAVAENVSHAFA